CRRSPRKVVMPAPPERPVRPAAADSADLPPPPLRPKPPGVDQDAWMNLTALAAGRGDSMPSFPTGLPQIKGYEILAEIGRGNMGVVYKARQAGLNRIVALKMVLAGKQADASQLARFQREAEAVGQLRHPNVVQIYANGEHDGQPFVVLEYLE